MKALGIIAEYNPFHEGHSFLIKEASALAEADVCVSVVSGNFIQRGGPAFYDKWTRAELAVEKGVDLVVEMPQCFASSSAAYFAGAGVGILADLKCQYIAFGSETGALPRLMEIANAIDDVENNHIHEIRMESGLSYPAARSKVLAKHYKDISSKDLSGPNDILGIEYLRAINKKKYDIAPISVMRTGQGHHASATEIRKNILKNKLQMKRWDSIEEKYFDLIRYRIIQLSKEELSDYDPAKEGLENRLKKELPKAVNLEDYIERLKSKRYTRTRISRLLAQIVLDIHPQDYMDEFSYIRPLAFNEKGSKYLKEIKKAYKDAADAPVFVEDVAKTLKHSEDSKLISKLEIDIRAGNVYGVLEGKDLYESGDYVKKPKLLSSKGF